VHRIDVHKLAGDAKFNRFHAAVLGWMFVILVLDGYDLAVAGIALPGIMKEMGVEAPAMGVMVSSALFGMMFGAIGLGVLGDKLGRRLAIAVCVLLFSVFTAAAGVACDPITFGVVRFIAGLGIGGVLPLCTALLTEYASASVRARFITIAACGYSIGGGLAALIGKALMEAYGWQVVFFAAGAPLILIPFILRFVPESLPFLLKQKRDAEVRRIVSKLAPGQELQPQEQFVAPREDQGEKAPIGRLFQDGRAFSSLMFCLAFLTSLFTVYALSSWLTKLLAMSGLSIGSALNLVLAASIGGVVGALSSGWLADKLHIKWVLMACYLLTGASVIVMGYGASPSTVPFVAGAVGAFSQSMNILTYVYVSQFYPSSVRSTGVGFASGVGRVGGIVAPILIGWLVSLQLPLQQNFLAIAVAPVLGAVAILFVNDGRSASTHHYDAAMGIDPSTVPEVPCVSSALLRVR
jgi:AAHS family benzoate transporter-like MFS transporter